MVKKTPPKKSSRTPSGREPTKKIHYGKNRKASSATWLSRHINDPYVQQAQRDGYRSRAAYKLLEIDEKANLIKPHSIVVDLGSAPGGWCQVLVQKQCRKIVAIDLLEMDSMQGVDFMQLDFMQEDAPDILLNATGGKVDLVLSDMAHNTTGHSRTDHIKIVAMVEAAYDFARGILKPDGAFLAKVFQGGTEGELLKKMKQDFVSVKHVKPKASRAESAEAYVLAMGFRG
jgi:23S rRNA (uridine2552-2'-O)-methyltransferase